MADASVVAGGESRASTSSTAAKNASSLRGVLAAGLRLGAAGDVDAEGTRRLDRLGHVVGRQAAGEHDRRTVWVEERELPVEALAGAAGRARRMRVEQMEVGVKPAQVVHLRRVVHVRGLHDLGAGAPRGLAAVGRALVPVQLQQREAAAVGGRGHIVERRVHEHPGQLEPAVQLATDLLGGVERARARALRPEDHAKRPGAQVGDQAGIRRRRSLHRS